MTDQGRSRRELLKLAAAAPLAALTWTPGEARAARQAATKARDAGAFVPEFFNDHEYQTVRVLVDRILPADERSGSATDAGVPEFMDFMMVESEPARQLAMRGGLRWLDFFSQERFDRVFRDCDAEQQRVLLDAIAWPERAQEEQLHGVEFFNRFRDLTATGFWTSKMGFEDLDYRGNEFVAQWTGCPEEVLRKLGLLNN